MDQIKTISLPQQRSLSPRADNEGPDNELKLAHLFRLGQHYWPKDFTKGQAKEFLRDYLEDLSSFNAAEVENACRAWRQNAENKRYPRSAELILGAREDRKRKAEASSPVRVALESRPILWHFLPRDLWQPHWKESEVPAEFAGQFTKSAQAPRPETPDAKSTAPNTEIRSRLRTPEQIAADLELTRQIHGIKPQQRAME